MGISRVSFPMDPQTGEDQVSNEKNCLFRLYRGWHPTQLYRDHNNPLQGSLLTNQYNNGNPIGLDFPFWGMIPPYIIANVWKKSHTDFRGFRFSDLRSLQLQKLGCHFYRHGLSLVRHPGAEVAHCVSRHEATKNIPFKGSLDGFFFHMLVTRRVVVFV